MSAPNLPRSADAEGYEIVPLELIDPDPQQPRVFFTNIEELAQSIKVNGLLQNLVVRPKGERFTLVAGGRRIRALHLLVANGDWIGGAPCLIRKDLLERPEILIGSLTENDAREPIPPWDAGFKYQELRDFGMIQHEIAARVGKHHSYVAKCCQIVSGLHPDVINKCRRVPELVTIDDALAMSKIVDALFVPDLPAQTRYFEKLINRKSARIRGRPTKREPYEKVKRRWLAYCQGLLLIPPEYQEAVRSFAEYLRGEPSRIALQKKKDFQNEVEANRDSA